MNQQPLNPTGDPSTGIAKIIHLQQSGLLGSVSADLLRSCSYLSPDPMPLELAESCGTFCTGMCHKPKATLSPCLSTLQSLSLVKVDSTLRCFSIEPNIQEMLRNSFPLESGQYWWRRGVQLVLAHFRPVCLSRWAEIERLMPHAQSLLKWGHSWQTWPEEAHRLQRLAGFYLRERGRFTEAEKLGYDQLSDEMAMNC